MFETAIPGAGYGYGAQQIAPQGFSPQGFYGGPQGFYGNPQRFAPYNAGQGSQGFGYPAGQSVLPLTIGPGTIPFQLPQQQLALSQLGLSSLGFSQPQLPQPQFQVVPVATPQGWVGQVVLVSGQPLGTWGGYGAPQIPVAPWSMGIPQQLPQAYVPLVPFSATPFSGQPIATTPIH